MKLLRIIAVLLLVASAQYSVAQNRRIDSLFKASIATAHDSVVFAANFELAIEYFWLNEKKTDAKALRCLEKAFQLARSMKDLRREAKIVNQRAQFYRRTNRLNESVQEFKKLETLYDRLGDKKSK